MPEKIKEAILNPTEKKRYQISAEYFSRGAANELKNKFNLPQLKGIENIVGKIKKEKEVDEEKEKSKKSVIGKIAILSGLVIGGVLLFKNLNNLFPNKKQDTNTSQEISYALDETKIDNSTKELNETLRKSYIDGFSTPLIGGIKLLTSINPSTLGEELTRGLTNDQILHNGIIGQVLYNITLAATWHVFERRGYEFILATFDFPMADRVYFNVGMWRKYKTDPTQYAHVGRDLVNNSIKGAEIQEVSGENYLNIFSDVDFSLTNIDFFKRFSGIYYKDVKYHEGENGIVHPSEIFNMINNNPVFLRNGRSRTYSRNTPIREIKITHERSRQVIRPANDSHHFVNEKIDYTWKPFADYIDDWDEYDNGGLPPTVVRAPAQYTFINKQWDYVYEMYEFNKTNQTIQDLLPTYQMLIQPNTTTNDKNKFWSMGDLVRLVQLSYYAAEWELYQALQSINSTRGLYQEIFRKQQIDVLTNKIAQRELELRRQAEDFQIAYANGQIDAQAVVTKMKERILEITKKPLKWIENDIKLHSNSYKKQIPYINIKEMVGRIKREVLRLGVSGTKEENVLVLDNQSLRDNFDLRRRQNVDTNLAIKGQQFGRNYTNESEFIYSNNAKEVGYENNWMYQLIWKKNFFDGEAPMYRSGKKWGWWEVTNDEGYYYWHPGMFGENGDDGDGAWGYSWNDVAGDVSKPNWADSNDKIITKNYSGSKTITDYELSDGTSGSYHSWTAYPWAYFLIRPAGVRKKFVNETYDNGNFYLVYTWEYFNNSGTFIKSVEIERKPSLKSHAAIYQGEYNTDKLDELYALPLELLERNLKDVADYVTQELLQAYEERNRLIEEIHAQCVVDSQDQNLRRLIISK